MTTDSRSSQPWRDLGAYLAERFGCKMQKLTVDAGFSCPNRDGTIGRGGCTYCNNRSFSPAFSRGRKSVGEQLREGKAFFARKYPSMRYLAYFQSYTNTYGSLDRLMALYEEALAVDGVDGLIIGTRPDCVDDALLDHLAAINSGRARVVMEYGAESSHDVTLRLINRCHDWAATVDAVRRTAARGIDCGLHLINGLPGETDEMMLQTVDRVNELPVATVKFHQLQLIRGTRMAADVEAGLYDIRRWSAEEYAAFCCRLIERLRPDIAIERFVSQSPADLLIWPRWGLKNYEFTNLLRNRLKKI